MATSRSAGRSGNLPPVLRMEDTRPLSIRRGFDDTKVWIFDLDNTLYPSACNLFAEVDRKMAEYIVRLLDVPIEHARYLQKSYYHDYGTTLTGLVKLHKIDPHDFLEFVHDIDLSALEPAPELERVIASLPGRRIIFTNGSRVHAERVAGKLGVLHLMEDICDIAACEFVAKPSPDAFDRMVRRHGVAPGEAAMFEDMPQNLEAPHTLGMTTVLVHSDYDDHRAQAQIRKWRTLPDHIHHATDDLTGFLESYSAVPDK
ncbi:pyrimidine 5'-nucleotidase [Hyphomicrobium sulfonivorans]|nr:pyrimidine 5'-nucleotidase [Hyphomicrobium sulfonivorans]